MSTVVQEPQAFFQACQKRLGGTARLGISAVLFDPSGEKRADISFNEDARFPMASVVKVPIAMLIASEIANGALSLHETITIHPRAFSPGLITNPIDRFYFLPFATVRTYTVEQLMAFMIHDSDNTATDAILNRLGGTCAVMKFLFASDIEGISVKQQLVESPMARETNVIFVNDASQEPGRCANRQRIAAGLKEHGACVKSLGHKTGSVGAIANDVGIIHFNNGCFAALAVMTCHSTVRISVRDEQIATVTRTIVSQWSTERLFDPCHDPSVPPEIL